MEAEKAKAVNNFDALPMADRWSLYRLWVSISVKEASERSKQMRRAYNKVVNELEVLNSTGDIQIMRQSKV